MYFATRSLAMPDILLIFRIDFNTWITIFILCLFFNIFISIVGYFMVDLPIDALGALTDGK